MSTVFSMYQKSSGPKGIAVGPLPLVWQPQCCSVIRERWRGHGGHSSRRRKLRRCAYCRWCLPAVTSACRKKTDSHGADCAGDRRVGAPQALEADVRAETLGVRQLIHPAQFELGRPRQRELQHARACRAVAHALGLAYMKHQRRRARTSRRASDKAFF